MFLTPAMNFDGASPESDCNASTTSNKWGWHRMRPCPMIWKDRVMMFAPSTVMAMGKDM